MLKTKNENLLHYPKKIWTFLYLAVIALLIVATFWDYAISSFLYQKNSLFGILGYCYGPLPCFWAFAFFGYALVHHYGRKKILITVALILFALALVFGSTLYIAIHAAEYYSSQPANWLVALFSVSLPPCGLFFWLARRYDSRQILIMALFVFLTAAISFAITTILKTIFLRPRFRLLQEYDSVSFKPWYSLARPNILEGVDMDQYYSFPSGHTTTASCFLAFCYLFKKPKQKWVIAVALIWIVLTALSRIVAGAHFLSDVSVAFLITLSVSVILYRIFESWRRKRSE